MVAVLKPRPEESVLDPACGTGGFLAEAHAYQIALGTPTGRLQGVEKDFDLYRLAFSMLRMASLNRGDISNADALKWTTTSHALFKPSQFDVVLTNPPFGTKIGVRDEDILRQYELARQWVDLDGEWRPTDVVTSTQDPQILFLELCIRMLRPGGRLGIVLPEGVFGNARSAFVWEWLQQRGKVIALLDCPRTTFQPGTDTKTNVLFFRKGKDSRRQCGPAPKVWVASAIHCGHDRRGRTHLADGRPFPDDFLSLAHEFQAREHTAGRWSLVSIGSGNYWVPRYYERTPRTPEEEQLCEGATWVALGQLVDGGELIVRKGHEVGSHAYGTGEIPFVRTSDISNFEISADPTKAVSDDVYREYSGQQDLKPRDVLIVVDGRYRIGSVAMLTESNYRCVVQSHLRVLSLQKGARIDSYELMFALTLPSVKSRIRDLVFVQSTLGTLGRRLFELQVPTHGTSPVWKARLKRFKTLLQVREQAFGELREIAGNDCEL